MSQLIRCISCNELFLKTPFDQWPEFPDGFPESGDLLRFVERNDFRDFMERHPGHRLENLTVVEDSFVSEEPYIEPVKVSYFRATNGKEDFVVKKSRDKIDEPLQYHFISEDYFLICRGIDIQRDVVAKQLRTELGKLPRLEEKIASFLEVFQQIVSGLEIQRLERVAADSPHPLEIYYKVDNVSLTQLLHHCRKVFDGREYEALETFVHGQKDDGVLLLKARYAIQLSEKARTKEKRPVAVAIDQASV